MAIMTYAAKSDAAILSDLNSAGLSVAVDQYDGSTAQITFESAPSNADKMRVKQYLARNAKKLT